MITTLPELQRATFSHREGLEIEIERNVFVFLNKIFQDVQNICLKIVPVVTKNVLYHAQHKAIK